MAQTMSGHIHITPSDAERFKVKNKDTVKVQVFTNRPVIFEDVDVRVSDKFNTSVHIDYDEANSCGYKNGCVGIILQ